MEKVLIVDDNGDLALAMELRLRANAYQIVLAHDGTSAVAQALAERPMAILLDLHLKQEDGFDIMQKFRSLQEFLSVPIIIVSADCSPLTQRRALEAGAFAFFEKPVDHRLLLSALGDIRLRSQHQSRVKATT